MNEEADNSNISIEIIGDSEETYSEQIIGTNVGNHDSIAQSDWTRVEQTDHIIASTAEVGVKSNISTKEVPSSSVEGSYKELSKQIERMVIPHEAIEISEERGYELLHPDAYLNTKHHIEETPFEYVGEDVMPSAPCFDEVPQTQHEVAQYVEVERVIDSKPKVKCMSIDDAIKLCGGKEMEEVMAMSEREEELVEAGPLSGPEHPLVDLLSTFRFVERLFKKNGG